MHEAHGRTEGASAAGGGAGGLSHQEVSSHRDGFPLDGATLSGAREGDVGCPESHRGCSGWLGRFGLPSHFPVRCSLFPLHPGCCATLWGWGGSLGRNRLQCGSQPGSRVLCAPDPPVTPGVAVSQVDLQASLPRNRGWASTLGCAKQVLELRQLSRRRVGWSAAGETTGPALQHAGARLHSAGGRGRLPMELQGCGALCARPTQETPIRPLPTPTTSP